MTAKKTEVKKVEPVKEKKIENLPILKTTIKPVVKPVKKSEVVEKKKPGNKKTTNVKKATLPEPVFVQSRRAD